METPLFNINQQVYLSLGGNKKNTLTLFKEVLDFFDHYHELRNASSIYSSEPWGFEEATDTFYNQVIEIATKLSPKELLLETQALEKKLGRAVKTNGTYQARTIDIDILIFNEKVINSKKLTIPHALMHKRNFVLIPFAEIAPDFVHPVFHKTIKDLLLYSPDELTVFKLK